MTYAPTEREMQMLRAYLDTGSCKGVGVAMELTEQAVKQSLHYFRRRAGANSNAALVYAYHEELSK